TLPSAAMRAVCGIFAASSGVLFPSDETGQSAPPSGQITTYFMVSWVSGCDECRSNAVGKSLNFIESHYKFQQCFCFIDSETTVQMFNAFSSAVCSLFVCHWPSQCRYANAPRGEPSHQQLTWDGSPEPSCVAPSERFAA